MISSIAVYVSKKFSDTEVEACQKLYSYLEIEEIRNHLMDKVCAEDYRVMFGQRSRREGWDNANDLTEKDGLPGEVEVYWLFVGYTGQ